MTSDILPAPAEKAGRFSGVLLTREDEGYLQARMARVYHSRHPERHPAAILVAADERDVVEGVRLAVERGWQVGVRSGGHSFPVWGVRDDALLIDLGNLKHMELDERTGIVQVSPAVQGGAELNPYLKSHGRFFASGGCSSVGLGGFLLQGGMGWNHRGWGFSAEQVVAIDVVTADGELVRADEQNHPDLFWAARGAGPGFPGVVTRFHLRTRPLPAGMSMTLHMYPLSSYQRVLTWLHDIEPEISSDVHLAALSGNPPMPLPGHQGGYIFAVVAVAFSDTYEQASEALAPLRGSPELDQALLVADAQPTSIEEQHGLVDSLHPEGLRYRVDSAWVDGPTADVVAATRTLVEDRPDEEAGHTFFWWTLPRDAPDMAQDLHSSLMVGAYIIYRNAADDETYRAWSLAAMQELEPYTVGQYWGDSDQQHREVACLTAPAWDRLQRVLDVHDPNRVFVDYLAGEGGFQNVNGWSHQPDALADVN